jgi:hypothetical protein
MGRSSFSDRRRSGFLTSFLMASRRRNSKRSERTPGAPNRPANTKSWLRLLAYALAIIAAAALVVAVIVFAIGIGSDDVDPTHKVLELTAQDIDPETTAVEKNLLKQNQIDGRLVAALWRDARQQLSGVSLKEAQRALADGRANPALEPLIKQLAADFATGKAATSRFGWPRTNPSEATRSIFNSTAYLLADSPSNKTVTRLPSLKERGNRCDWRSPAHPAQIGAPFSAPKRQRAKPRPDICTWEEKTPGAWWSNDRPEPRQTKFSSVLLDGSVIESELVHTL